MDEDDFLLLLFLTNSPKYNTKTHQWRSDEIFKRTGHRYSRQVLSYHLKKYSELTGKRATKSTHLGESPRIAWSRKGCPAVVEQKGQKGPNYTLILCVRNVEKGAVVSSKLIKNVKKKIKDEKTGKVRIKKGTDAIDFYDFLKNIELPTNEKYYLLLDNSKIHYTTKELEKLGLSMEELAKQKNIELVYLPKYTPELNPIELCFNTARYLTENLPTDAEEELEAAISKIINMFNQKNMS
ncbi:23614_t:CDS:2, partial [Racocetra persica]